jgi:DNA invertase Pin-like site-specific DNA recombinase
VAAPYSNPEQQGSFQLAQAVAVYASLTYPHRSLKALEGLRDKAKLGVRVSTSTNRTAYRIDRRLGSERISNVVAAYKAGATARSIARQHGVSNTALVQFLRDAGVPIGRQPLTEAQLAQIVDLYEQGASTYEIERATGTPKSTVGRALNEAGTQMRPRGGSRPRTS